jgi:hypothetical protein
MFEIAFEARAWYARVFVVFWDPTVGHEMAISRA